MAQISSDDHTAYSWLRINWFYPLAIAVVLSDVSALNFQDWSHPRLFEGAVLFDLAVILPLLYLSCYRAKGAAVILPIVSVASLGIWATSRLIPAEHQHILGSVSWLRTMAIAVLVMIEIKILFGFYKAIFASDKTPEEIAGKLSKDIKLPLWLTRLVALEARILRRLSDFVNSLLRRR